MIKYTKEDKKLLAIKILIPTLLLGGYYFLSIFLIAINSKELPNIEGTGAFIVVMLILGVIIFGKINLLFDSVLGKSFVNEYKDMHYELIGNQIFIKKGSITEIMNIEDIHNIILKDNYFILSIENIVYVVPLNYKDDEVLESIMDSIT